MQKVVKSIFLTIFGLLAYGKYVLAANLKDAFSIAESTASSSYNTKTSLAVIGGNLITVIFSLVGSIFIIFVVYGGYLYMTAAGNDEKADKGKRVISQSIIGVVVLMAAYAITYFLIKFFI